MMDQHVPVTILPLVLLAVPLIEIAVFVLVGSQIGVLATIGLVIATAVAGSILLRIQGFGVLSRIRAKMESGGNPGRDLVDALMVMLAGILLLTPGFVTDSIGILLFLPPVRTLVWSFLSTRIVVMASGMEMPGRRGRDGRTIDLDSEDFVRERQPERRTPTIEHDS